MLKKDINFYPMQVSFFGAMTKMQTRYLSIPKLISLDFAESPVFLTGHALYKGAELMLPTRGRTSKLSAALT